MIIIDKIAYSSNLKEANPLEKFIFSISTLVICLIFSKIYLSIFVIFAISILITKRAKIPFKIYGGLLLIPLLFLFLSIIPLLISFDYEGALMVFKVINIKFGVTKYSLNLGLKTFLKVFSCICCLYFLTLTTPSTQILWVLRKMMIPKIFIEFMQLIYRCIFIVLEVSSMIIVSQNSRLGYRDLKRSFNSISKLLSSLFVMSYKKSEDMFIALEARCYNGEIKFIDAKYNYSIKNILFILFFLLILIFIGFKFK
ncbi:MAG: cobalt ECF transporter T component CbiQ [Caloramator sp.]|nr:cobalt ECF transporter T component CbiQ [Caloramator sp.]